MFKNYLSLVKFSHTIFAMPFALIGFFLAVKYTNGVIHWQIFLYVILCMVLARNAAMGFNRYLDRKIDEKNPRTKSREIPAGIIKEKFALWFVIINSLLFVAVTFFINRLTLFLSPVALLVILGYSYTKKFTALCHFVLGIGLSLAPIGAFLSVTGEFRLLPLLFSFIVLLWVSGFDIIYALQDEDFDKAEKLKSVPAYLGRRNALYLSIIIHFICALITVFAGYYGGFGIYFWIGALLFIALLSYQHLLVKPNDISKVNLAFMTTNGIASVLFAVLTILDIFLG